MSTHARPMLARHWLLDRRTVFLNHGSFGSCPKPVLTRQNELRRRLEREPIRFLVGELEKRLDEARGALADFVGADSGDMVFVPNATAGVNTVLRSLAWRPGDQLLTTNHVYNACGNALRFAAERSGAKVVVAEIPFPFRTASQLVEPILAAVTPRTRLALLDHVTSPTAIVFPIRRLVRELAAHGVDTLVDGAHAPGMVPLNLRRLGVAYYTGNCHKWLCAPKGAAFLYVRQDRQPEIRPLTISHGANSTRTDRPRFQLEFGWTGTCDPTPYLCVPEALRFVGSLRPGGWPEIMARNHALAARARRTLCRELRVPPPCPEAFLGSMAAVPLPDGRDDSPPKSPLYTNALQDALRDRHRIEVPIVPWPAPPKRLVRVSAQLYNSPGDYRNLAGALSCLLRAEARRLTP